MFSFFYSGVNDIFFYLIFGYSSSLGVILNYASYFDFDASLLLSSFGSRLGNLTTFP